MNSHSCSWEPLAGRITSLEDVWSDLPVGTVIFERDLVGID